MTTAYYLLHGENLGKNNKIKAENVKVRYFNHPGLCIQQELSIAIVIEKWRENENWICVEPVDSRYVWTSDLTR